MWSLDGPSLSERLSIPKEGGGAADYQLRYVRVRARPKIFLCHAAVPLCQLHFGSVQERPICRSYIDTTFFFLKIIIIYNRKGVARKD